jgi:hypothetical protein
VRVAAQGHEAGYHGVVLLICAAALALSAVLTPGGEGSSLFGYPWPWHCWLHETFGVKCALCGLSRSFSCLARGDIAAGLEFHRLGPAVFALFCLEIPYRIYAITVSPRRVDAKLAKLHVAAVSLVAAGVFGNWLLYLGELIA